MKLKLELASVQTALDTITKITPPTSGTINFNADKKLIISALSDSGRCQVVVPCTVEGQGSFALPLQVFRDAIKGRTEFSLSYKNSIATITAGSYKVELSTTDVIPFDELELVKPTQWVLDQDQIDWLNTACKIVELKPTPTFSEWMPLGIKLTDKGGFVACYDANHMSWSSSKAVSGAFDCVIPYNTLANILSVCKTKFKIIHTDSHIRVKSALHDFTLALPTLEGLPTLDQVQAKIKEAAKIEGAALSFSVDDAKAFLDNAKSVMGTSERAELSVVAGKGVELAIKSAQGHAKIVLAGKGKTSFKVDSTYLYELLSKSKEELTLTVVESAFLAVKTKSGGTLIALNQA